MEIKKIKEVLIIIPAYNEEKNIEKLLNQLQQPEIRNLADILIMNDASSDLTNQIAKRKKVDLVTHVFNLGYGSALQLGYKYAIRRGYKYVIQMDADGQHDVCNVGRIYQELTTPGQDGICPDIVLGSRFLKDSAPYHVSPVKKFAIGLFRGFIKMATGREIKDPTTGLQGLNRKAFGYYSRFNHFDDRYPDANILMNMLLLGFRIREIPAVMHTRTEGVSMHSGLKPVVYMFRMMFSILAVWVRVKILKTDIGAIRDEIF